MARSMFFMIYLFTRKIFPDIIFPKNRNKILKPTEAQILKASEYYSLFGVISVPFIQYKLKVTHSLAMQIIKLLIP